MTEVGILEILLEGLENCTDYRDGTKVYYSLTEILFLSFCGVLSGCESYQDICDFGELKLDWLRKYKPYENGIPSHDTINRAMSLLNTNELSKLLQDVSTRDIQLSDGEVVHIDGKMLSGSATKKQQQTKKSEGGRQALHTVNVFCSSLRSCIASEKVQLKGGEKQVLKDILAVLDLRGCLLTMDANFCFKDVATDIQAHEADYLLGLKKNQPILYETAKQLLACEDIGVQKHIGKEEQGHGRIEKRDCYVLNIKQIEQDPQFQHKALFCEWKGLKSLIQVNSVRTIITSNKTAQETRYYISSKEFNPLEANDIIRGHWEIENNLHWVLDTAFGEDENRKRDENAAFAFSIFRKIAFNKLNNFPDAKTSIKRKMRKCAMSEAYLEKVLYFS